MFFPAASVLICSFALIHRLSVRVVSSSRGGLGKTLFVRRVTDQLPNLVNNDMVSSHSPSTSLHVTVPLHGNSTDSSMLVDSLLPHEVRSNVPLSRVFHLDVSPSVRKFDMVFSSSVLSETYGAQFRIYNKEVPGQHENKLNFA